jgi:hypothetical protein
LLRQQIAGLHDGHPHDRDGKFSQPFDDAVRDAGLKVQMTAFLSPNTVAYVERFIQSLQQEVLDYFIVFGRRHEDDLVLAQGDGASCA